MMKFEPLNEGHFPLVHSWFNKPHVQTFYSLRDWTFQEVCQKLIPYTQGLGGMQCYIISLDNQPIGYIQSYPVKKHPWDNQKLTDEIIQNAAGIDLFIGEKTFLGKGLGIQVLDAFLKGYIWPHYRYCIADPSIHNESSMRLFQKYGFEEHQQIETMDALQRRVRLQLFIKKKD